jgi:hypothetical protein
VPARIRVGDYGFFAEADALGIAEALAKGATDPEADAGGQADTSALGDGPPSEAEPLGAVPPSFHFFWNFSGIASFGSAPRTGASIPHGQGSASNEPETQLF